MQLVTHSSKRETCGFTDKSSQTLDVDENIWHSSILYFLGGGSSEVSLMKKIEF